MEKSQLQFSNPVLTKLMFYLNPAFKAPEDGTVSLITNFNTKISSPEDSESPVVVALEVSIRAEDAENSPFEIEAEMAAQFLWVGENIAEVDLGKLLNQNAPALLLGYLRPIVASTTMQAGLPPYHIPFMSFVREKDGEN